MNGSTSVLAWKHSTSHSTHTHEHIMSNKQAPPLGNLTRSEQPSDKPLPTPQLPTAKPVQSSVPVGTEKVYSAPGVPNNYDFSKVQGPAGDALASYATQRNDAVPLPMLKTLDSRPEMPVSDTLSQQLGANESTPFNYTGFGAGTVGREQITTDVTRGVAKYNSQVGQPIENPLAFKGSSDIVIGNSRPIDSFTYTEGLTQSQRNSRDFFGGLQEWRRNIEPVQLPAIQFTPQQLNPNVAGGFSPTAETKGPLSWLVDGQQKDFNPLKLEFGGMGGGFLGGAGWLFSRLSPVTYLQGAALDVSRNAASLIEGGSAGLTELFKSGDFGKAYSQGLDAAWENYEANSPRNRGLTAQTIFGNKALGDFFSNSYIGTAASGMADYSFSGTGNNPLITGDASYGVVNKGDNFNPFGLRDPIRSGFNTGALEAEERKRANAAWNATPYRALPGNPFHGYDQWIRGGAGLVVDIFGSARVDKLALGAVRKSVPTVTRNGDDLAAGIAALRSPSNNPARYIPSPPGALVPVTKVPVRDIPDISEFLPKTVPSKGGALVVPPAKGNAITQVVDGEILEPASSIVLRKGRTTPEYYNPIANRYLPQGADPFSASSTRPYVPAPSDMDFSAGGAIVPYSGKQSSELVPSVLGVGGKPGGIPVNPRADIDRVFVAGTKDAPPVTMWDDATQSFVTTGTRKGVQETRTMVSPGKTPDLPQTPLPEAARPLSESVNNLTLPTVKQVNYDVPPTKELPVLVPRDTPNFTVQPSAITDEAIRTTHTVNEATGTYVNTTEQAAILARKVVNDTPVQVGDLPAPIVPPAKEVQYVTAEAISPSLTSADIVRRLTSGDDITGAVYNPRQVERQTRSIGSVVSLARQVTLPGGVRILGDDIKDISVMKFSRLQKKVDAAIVASGLNPSSTEAAAVRRLFDRNGKPLPTNLAPDFSIEVAARTIDTPTTYVKPPTQVADGNVTWTGRAARYTPTYELSGDYAIGVRVKYDDELKRIVPVDGMDAKMIPPVRSERSINRSALLDLPVADRQTLVSKSFVDGYSVPKGAVDDVLSPDIMTDTMAAKSYAQANIPRDSIPPRMDRAARTELAKHADIVEEAAYTRELITDVSTQLTDVERSLNSYLKRIDELPDIGVGSLTDDVPFSPLPKLAMEDVPPVSGMNNASTLGSLYHGTRVDNLNLRAVNPLEGAARSEYGTGVWLTNSQEVATSAAGRSVPSNSVPNVNRTYSDSSYIHEVPGNALDDMNVPRADSVPTAKVTQDVLTQLDNNRFVFSDVIPYGDDLVDEVVNLLESGKVTSYTDLFSKVDDLTHKVARRNTGAKPDEYELTYVQRVMTDLLQGSGVQGLTNGVNTVVYDTRNLTAKFVHDVTDIVGDASDDVTTALHNVNLLQRSLDAEPNSKLLQVQLAEAKAVATSRVRDSLVDELEQLQQVQSKQISDLLDQDEVVSTLAKKQRSEELGRATVKDESTYDAFSKELNRSDWTGPCL
jgi:hypothetical protein